MIILVIVFKKSHLYLSNDHFSIYTIIWALPTMFGHLVINVVLEPYDAFKRWSDISSNHLSHFLPTSPHYLS